MQIVDLNYQIEDDKFLLEIAYEGSSLQGLRSEGLCRVKLENTCFEMSLDSEYFENFDAEYVDYHMENRIALISSMVFAPIFTFYAGGLERERMGLHSKAEGLYVRSNFRIAESLLKRLNHPWIYPNLEFENVSKGSLSRYVEDYSYSLSWGGGLDSTSAICMLHDFEDEEIRSYTLDQSTEDFKISNGEEINFPIFKIDTNMLEMYSIPGFPHWMSPMIPSIFKGDSFHLSGSILEAYHTADDLNYRGHKPNLWRNLVGIVDLKLIPMKFSSEFLNAQIIFKSGFADLACEDFITEWGIGYKSLRKAIYMRVFDSKYEDVILFLENKGFVIDFDSTFTERSRFASSVCYACSKIEGSESISVKNIKNHTNFLKNTWSFKYNPQGLENLTSSLRQHLISKWETFGIESMEKADLEVLESYEYFETLGDLIK